MSLGSSGSPVNAPGPLMSTGSVQGNLRQMASPQIRNPWTSTSTQPTVARNAFQPMGSAPAQQTLKDMSSRANPTRRDFTQPTRTGTTGPKLPGLGSKAPAMGAAAGFKSSGIIGSVVGGTLRAGWGSTKAVSKLVPRQWRYAAAAAAPIGVGVYGANKMTQVNAGSRYAMHESQRSLTAAQTSLPEMQRQTTIRQGSGYIRPSDYRRMHGEYEPQYATQAWAPRATTPQYRPPQTSGAGGPDAAT
jgi:hypothetical protein